MPNILVLEDRPSDIDKAREAIGEIGGTPYIVSRVCDARELIRSHDIEFSAAIIDRDLGANEPDGLELVDWIDIERPGLPTIVTTAAISPADQRRCYEKGVLSFLSKPYLVSDLVMHLNVRFKLYIFPCGHLQFHTKYSEARWDDERLALQPKAFTVLSILAHKCGEPVPRRAIQRRVWRDDDLNQALSCEISKIRKELKRFCGDAEPILFENDCYTLSGEAVGFRRKIAG